MLHFGHLQRFDFIFLTALQLVKLPKNKHNPIIAMAFLDFFIFVFIFEIL